MPSFDGGDNFVWIGDPFEGFGMGVVVVEEAIDRGLEVGDGSEDSAFEAAFSEGCEKTLNGVEPGGRREVEGPSRIARKPLAHDRMLVSSVIVEDGVDGFARGDLALNCVEKANELLVSMALHVAADHGSIEALFVDLFLDGHAEAPKEIVLDLDATDDPLHGHQEGRFFHGYYDCYCYLPLYVFCGRHLLAAKLRPSNIDGSAGAKEEIARIVAQIRSRWPGTRILLRADSGFAREALMVWCQQNRVDFVFGLARNARLVEEISVELL